MVRRDIHSANRANSGYEIDLEFETRIASYLGQHPITQAVPELRWHIAAHAKGSSGRDRLDDDPYVASSTPRLLAARRLRTRLARLRHRGLNGASGRLGSALERLGSFLLQEEHVRVECDFFR